MRGADAGRVDESPQRRSRPTLPRRPPSRCARTSDERGVAVEIASIDRIIPLDGDVAEIVFALGMGDHVVATDLSATYPP